LASLEHAQPFLRFRLDRALGTADLSTHEGRGRTAAIAAAIVAEHPSELVRDQYVMELAERLQIDADTLRNEVARAKDHPPARKPERNTAPPPEDGDAPPPAPPPVVDRREVDLLRWVIHEPEVVADWLDEPLLLDATARAAYELLESTHDFHEAIAAAHGPVRELLERLAVEEPTADDERPVMQARLMVNTVAPVAQHLLEQMMRDGDDRASAIKADLDSLAHAREVGDWDAARGVAERLVGWVVEAARASAPEVVEQSV
jgi:DNA primase